MPNFNQVTIIGTLGRDPEVKYTAGGTAVCEVSLAINRQWFDKSSNQKKESTTWVTVVMWGKTAELAGEYLSKGKPVLVSGRLEESVWDDKDSGQKRSKLKVVCESMQFLGSKQDGGGQRQERSESPAPQQPTPEYNPTFPSDGSDVPF